MLLMLAVTQCAVIVKNFVCQHKCGCVFVSVTSFNVLPCILACLSFALFSLFKKVAIIWFEFSISSRATLFRCEKMLPLWFYLPSSLLCMCVLLCFYFKFFQLRWCQCSSSICLRFAISFVLRICLHLISLIFFIC